MKRLLSLTLCLATLTSLHAAEGDDGKVMIFDLNDPVQRAAMQAFVNQETPIKEIPALHQFTKEWEQQNPEHAALFKSPRKKQLIAEAWHWQKELGLFAAYEKHGLMTYEGIASLAPYTIRHGGKQAPGNLQALITQVCDKLVAPDWSHEASEALTLSAMSHLISKIGIEEYKQAAAARN